MSFNLTLRILSKTEKNHFKKWLKDSITWKSFETDLNKYRRIQELADLNGIAFDSHISYKKI